MGGLLCLLFVQILFRCVSDIYAGVPYRSVRLKGEGRWRLQR